MEVVGAAFVVQDEGHDFVAEALFEHQKSADTTVAVFERMDPFKSNVEIQNPKQIDLFQAFILSQQYAQLGVDILRRCGLCFS